MTQRKSFEDDPCLNYCKKVSATSPYSDKLTKQCIESCNILETLLKDFVKAVEFECKRRGTGNPEFCTLYTLSVMVMTLPQMIDHIAKEVMPEKAKTQRRKNTAQKMS